MSSINTAIMSTAVARKIDRDWTVQSPLAGFIAHGKDRISAVTKFIEMLGAYMFAQQRQAESEAARGRGRPSKNYEAHIHVQVQRETKDRFDVVTKEFNLSQSETILFLLDSFDMLKLEFVSAEEMNEAEKRLLQPVGAGK